MQSVLDVRGNFKHGCCSVWCLFYEVGGLGNTGYFRKRSGCLFAQQRVRGGQLFDIHGNSQFLVLGQIKNQAVEA
jgi:hypothetical protein